ncbi:MAG TPA: translocation/assembly module TamB domain-containing protein [Planctomycetota bacterium]|nr:translocation/assembly module TamB domain-containing protein [Planctomycetota bacterium]
MKVPKAVRWTAAALGGVLLLGFGVWLLRWPLFEEAVRRTIRDEIGRTLEADVRIGSLGGSLLRGLLARDVVLTPRPGSPLRAASVERVEVRYGLLGRGPVVVRARGAAVELARGDPGARPFGSDDLRHAEKSVRDLRIPVRVHLAEGVLVLPDGRRLRVLEGELADDRLRATLDVPDAGRVEAVAERRHGDLRVDATATEGPIRELHLELGVDRARLRARVLDRPLAWVGRIDRGPEGRVTHATGTLTSPEGSAETVVDLEAGRLAARIEAAVRTEHPVRAAWTATGQVSGPLFGPLEDWILVDARARAADAAVEGLRIDEIVIRVPSGSPRGADVRAVARRGADWAEFEGRLGPGEPVDLRGLLRASVRDARPYLGALEAAPDLRMRDATFTGRVRYDGRPYAVGRLTAGAGEAWSSLEAELSVHPDGVDLPVLRLAGAPAIGRLDVSAAVQVRSDGGIDARVDGRAGAFDVALEGHADASGRVEARGKIQGADGLRATPEASVQTHDGGWSARLEPGTLVLPGGAILRHGPVEAEGSDAEILARASGVGLDGVDLGSAEVRIVPGPGLEGSVAWSSPSGERLRAEGRWTTPRTLDVELRVPDLARSIVKAWLPGGPDLSGAASIELNLRGEEGGGRLVLSQAAAGPGEPVSLDVPFRVEDGALRAVLAPTQTPYGRLSFDARVGLDDVRVKASGRLLDVPFAAAAPFLGEKARAWIPAGVADVQARVEGRPTALVWSARLDAWAAEARVPQPLGRLVGVRLQATADAGGVRLERLAGRLGGGSFEATGRWDGATAVVELEGQELLVVDRRLSRVRVAPDLRLVWPVEGRGLIEGDLRIGRVMVHEELATGGGGGAGDAAADVLRVDGPRLRPAPGGGVLLPGFAGAGGVRLDVRVEAGRDVRIENSALGAMLDVAGRLSGTLAEPAWSGVVRARSGEVRLPAAIMVELDTVELVLPATPGAEPMLHAEGHVGRGEGSIRIVVDGPLASPAVDLRSTPPQPRDELLARLAFGQGRGEMSGEAAVGALALRVVDQYRAHWPEAEPKESFFDRVKPSLVGGEEEAATLKPWELPSSQSPRGLGVRTEVLLNEYFSIVAQGDEDANIGGDLKLRLRFR